MDVKFYYNNKSAPTPNTPTSIGCVAIVEKEKKILLEQRKDSNRWAFIGGGLELNETIEECVVREIKEETNLNITEIRFLNIFSNPSRIIKYPNGKIKRSITIAFKADIENFNRLICSTESHQLAFY